MRLDARVKLAKERSFTNNFAFLRRLTSASLLFVWNRDANATKVLRIMSFDERVERDGKVKRVWIIDIKFTDKVLLSDIGYVIIKLIEVENRLF